MENTNDKEMRQQGLIEDHPQKQIEDHYPENSQEEVLMFDNGPEKPAESVSNRAVKGSAWLLGIVALFAIAILVAWFVGRGDTPLDGHGDNTTYAMKKVNKKVVVHKVASLSAPQAAAGTSAAAPGSQTSENSSVSATDNSSAAYNDRIEEEAREVIHGDFGNNPGRKAKLGADYAAVQARVNQLLN